MNIFFSVLFLYTTCYFVPRTLLHLLARQREVEELFRAPGNLLFQRIPRFICWKIRNWKIRSGPHLKQQKNKYAQLYSVRTITLGYSEGQMFCLKIMYWMVQWWRFQYVASLLDVSCNFDKVEANQSSMVLYFQVPRSPLEKDSFLSYRSPSENVVHCNAKLQDGKIKLFTYWKTWTTGNRNHVNTYADKCN